MLKMTFQFKNHKTGLDYPSESAHVEPASDFGDDCYFLKNTLFFGMGVSLDDVVKGAYVDGILTYQSVVQKSGNRTMTIKSNPSTCQHKSLVETVELMGEMGISCETSSDGLFAINFPASESYEHMASLLQGKGYDVQLNDPGKNAHSTHCCSAHGCKYFDLSCPVENGLCAGIVCEDCQSYAVAGQGETVISGEKDLKKLEDFIAEKREELDRFYEFWVKQNATDPDRYPMTLKDHADPLSAWNKSLQDFTYPF